MHCDDLKGIPNYIIKAHYRISFLRILIWIAIYKDNLRSLVNLSIFLILTLSVLITSRRCDTERKKNILRSVVQIQSVHHTWLFSQQQVLLFFMPSYNDVKFQTQLIVTTEPKRERFIYFFSCSCRTQENVRIERVNTVPVITTWRQFFFLFILVERKGPLWFIRWRMIHSPHQILLVQLRFRRPTYWIRCLSTIQQS